MKKPCPMCKSRPVTTMETHIKDRMCELCGGQGWVDNEKQCKCGRPAVVKVKENTFTCTRNACIEKALAPVIGMGA